MGRYSSNHQFSGATVLLLTSWYGEYHISLQETLYIQTVVFECRISSTNQQVLLGTQGGFPSRTNQGTQELDEHGSSWRWCEKCLQVEVCRFEAVLSGCYTCTTRNPWFNWHDWLEQSPCCSFPEIHVTSSVMLFFPMPSFPGDYPFIVKFTNEEMELGPVPFGGINNMAIEILIFNRRYFKRSTFCCHICLLKGIWVNWNISPTHQTKTWGYLSWLPWSRDKKSTSQSTGGGMHHFEFEEFLSDSFHTVDGKYLAAPGIKH